MVPRLGGAVHDNAGVAPLWRDIICWCLPRPCLPGSGRSQEPAILGVAPITESFLVASHLSKLSSVDTCMMLEQGPQGSRGFSMAPCPYT